VIRGCERAAGLERLDATGTGEQDIERLQGIPLHQRRWNGSKPKDRNQDGTETGSHQCPQQDRMTSYG
jgi:hypothetical protein